jgi:hypothetical protein
LLTKKQYLNIPIRQTDRRPTSQKAAAHHQTLTERPNPPIGTLTDQSKAAAHHKTQSEHPNPPIGQLTDQPKKLLTTKPCLNIPIHPSDR